jgi:hypothetical protein
MRIDRQLIDWLLEGDVSVQYQVHRDLLGEERPDLRERIGAEGWGAKFLSFRKPEGHWGERFYQPKWISTHYTLLDLKNLRISPDNREIRESIRQIIESLKGPDGGILTREGREISDMCIDGMFLNYAAYFRMPEGDLKSIIDLILTDQLADGGFNCRHRIDGAVHSSMHTTISVLEGIQEYNDNSYRYRIDELEEAARQAREFLLMHNLFRSDRTGEIIDAKWLMLSYPSRWKYDILRVLDHFQAAGVDFDPRMQEALDVLIGKRGKDGSWPVQAKHSGKVHFDMEKTGSPSRWNTLRALRVLKHFGGFEAAG